MVTGLLWRGVYLQGDLALQDKRPRALQMDRALPGTSLFTLTVLPLLLDVIQCPHSIDLLNVCLKILVTRP
eukprot:19251-Eustigmatos_ZCMA.PRE.1